MMVPAFSPIYGERLFAVPIIIFVFMSFRRRRDGFEEFSVFIFAISKHSYERII
jgi:hypothetical protein